MRNIEQQEKLEALNCLRASVNVLREEAAVHPDVVVEGVRTMREGVSVFLDDYKIILPEFLLFSPELKFRTENVSFELTTRNSTQVLSNGLAWHEIKRTHAVKPVENTAAMSNVWLSNATVLFNQFEGHIRYPHIVNEANNL